MATHTPDLIPHLHAALLSLSQNPYPTVPCPENLPKRASVALILRVQPTYNHPPPSPSPSPSPSSQSSSPISHLHAFFSQPWVQHGSPELLFIKRASRVGDKWTGHVALPGGKRDAEDADDGVTAVREAMEEVGVDLGLDEVLAVGNLPQRIVTTSWGKVPYVYSLFLCVSSCWMGGGRRVRGKGIRMCQSSHVKANKVKSSQVESLIIMVMDVAD